MTRMLLFATLCLGIPAFAAGDREKAHDDMIDAQKDINQGKRKAANDEVKAQRELTGKLEDVAVTLLLPTFFAYTGMRTQIGLVSGGEAGSM